MNLKRLLSLTLIGTLLAAAAPALAERAAWTTDVPVYVTSQRFERGVMYYRTDTGYVWVLYDDGGYDGFITYSYGALPDNPIFNIPSGYVRPINGFGRIWGNHDWVRNRLGYAIRQEFGFQSRVVTRNQTAYLFEFDQTIIEISPNSTWRFVSFIPNPPPDQDPGVDGLNATPNPAQAGQTVTITWAARGTDMVLIEVYDSAGQLTTFFDHLALVGEVTITVPYAATGSMRVVAWAANVPDFPTSTALYERVVSAEVTINIEAQQPSTIYTRAAYQRYEHGFMIWRADTGAVLAFIGTQGGYMNMFPVAGYGTLPDNPYTNPPAGLVAPISGFGKVWGNYEYLRNQLGWATGPEQGYDMTIESYGVESAYLLPEGREALVTWQNYWSWK